MASTRWRVARTRLSVSHCLRASVQRPSAIGAPARLMTASALSRQCSQAPASRPFHSTVVTVEPHERCASSLLLVRRVTRCPSWQSKAHKGRPMNPVPPATTIVLVSSPRQDYPGWSVSELILQPSNPCHPTILARPFRPPFWDGPIVCVTLTPTDDSFINVSERETVLLSCDSVGSAAMCSRHRLQHDPSVRNNPL